MKLTAMAQAFADQMKRPDITQLCFEERFGLLVDFQMTDLENRRMRNRFKNAKLRLSASLEGLDFKQGRGLDRSTVMLLALNQWVKSHHNILVIGPTGAGKSHLACALAQKTCRYGHITQYQRLPRLLKEIVVSRLDDRYGKLLAPIIKCEVLILDDFLISPLTREE